MPTTADIVWFKDKFATDTRAAIAGTPFTLDMLAALACQETGEVWPLLRKKNLTTARVLELCVGDTIDGRSAFPRSKEELVAVSNGQTMFDIAHAALIDMAAFVPGYASVAQNPRKFCHGYGIFQYDIQFFKSDPDYFLQRRRITYAGTLTKAVGELKNALKKLGWQARTSLTDLEMAAVAITYNKGSYTSSKGLKQGWFDGHHYYGENYCDFLRLAHTGLDPQAAAPILPPAGPGEAVITPPAPIAAQGAIYEVNAQSGLLRLRSSPSIDSSAPTKNVIGQMPDGRRVQAVGTPEQNGFLEVETSLNGALLRGFTSVSFLQKIAAAPAPVVLLPAPVMPTSGVIAVSTPRSGNSAPRRTDLASAHSLNEPGQPGRSGPGPAVLRQELAAIIPWLATVIRPINAISRAVA